MSYLSELIDSTRDRIGAAKATTSAGALEQRIAGGRPPLGFTASLGGSSISLIGEIKRASPTAGDLNRALSASGMAAAYADGGAAALSVLTEPERFLGSLDDLEAALGAGLPVLRKDFILDDWQLLESRAAGADAVLLIVRALGGDLGGFLDATAALGMAALVEVHDAGELALATEAGATLVGVNHRDLATFEVDPDRTAKLAALTPEGTTLVALSGVSTRAEVEELEGAGADAVLVGEALVTAPDPAAKVRELLGQA